MILIVLIKSKNCLQGRRVHMGSHFFGRTWNKGDVVGCMINMEDKSMIFTLNGEILITNKGSELCFADFETEDGKQTIIFIKTKPVIYIILLKMLHDQNKSKGTWHSFK